MPNKETWKQVKEYVAIALTLGALGSQLKAEAAPPLDEPEGNKICLEGENKICIEKPKPVEIPNLGKIITVSGISEGEGERKIKVKQGIHSVESEEGIWGVAWHQLVARLVKTDEGEWYENVSQVCFTRVKEGESQAEAQVLMESLTPEEKVNLAQEISPMIYHDLRTDKAVYRDSIADELKPASLEVAVATEIGLSWSAHPFVVPHKEGFSIYFWGNGGPSKMPEIYRQDIFPEGRLGSSFVEVGNSQAWRKFYPAAVVDQEGNHLVFWEQDYEDRPGAFEIWAQGYDADGREMEDSFPISLMPYSQHPKAVLVGDKILATWAYPYIDEGRAQVELWGQYLTKQGELIGRSFPIFQDDKDQNGLHEMAVNSRGEVVVVRAANDGKIWGRLIEKNGGMGMIQMLAEEEGILMVGAHVAPFEKERFLVSGHKFQPWRYTEGQAFGLAVEVRSSARSGLEEQGVTSVDDAVRPFREKRLVASPVFLLSPETGQQFTSVSGGKEDSAFFAWESRERDGSAAILARSAW